MSSEESQSLGARLVASAGLIAATLMMTIDTTIANVALPHMQGSLSASPEQITWVLTSYIVASAVMTPLTGWMAGRFGRRRLLMVSTVAFVVVSMLCGAATSLTEMVLLRMLQGVAGAALIPMSQAAILDLWPTRLLAQAMAAWSAVIMAAPVLGPTLGGYLTDALSWRWVFYINLPIGLIALIAMSLGLPRDEPGRRPTLDQLGVGALIVFIVSLQLLLDRGPSRDWFDAPEIWIEAVLAACALHVFVIQTLTARNPYVPRGLLGDRNFMSTLGVQLLLIALLQASAALTPTLMQQLLGYSALQSGIVSAPRGFGSVAGFLLAPWISNRIGPRRAMFAGLLLNVAAFAMMSRFDLSMSPRPLEITGVLLGFGQALIFNPMAVLAYATLAPSLRNDATVIASMGRNLGASVGIAILQALSVRQSAAAHEVLAGHVNTSDPLVRWALPEIFQGPGGLGPLNAEVTRQGAMIAYDTVFGWMCAASLVMAPLILIMRPAKPGQGKGIEIHGE
jgi:DHA2 family multidrug resistance protein